MKLGFFGTPREYTNSKYGLKSKHTTCYKAPELLCNIKPSFKSDLWYWFKQSTFSYKFDKKFIYIGVWVLFFMKHVLTAYLLKVRMKFVAKMHRLVYQMNFQMKWMSLFKSD